MPVLSTSDVFGVSTKQVESYIERPEVDNKFVEALQSDKQIIVYGASKQGKTALVSRHLPYDKNIIISLTPQSAIIDIYHTILHKSGVKIKVSETQKSQSESSIGVIAKFKATIPLFGSGTAETNGKTSAGSSKQQDYEEIPINLGLPQNIAEILHRIKGNDTIVIILENFHYLDEERQKQFSFDLRSFQELKIQFVILGVWKEKNRLSQFNGDLLDRIIEIPVEPWTKSEFLDIAIRGEKKLNVNFTPELIELIINSCFSSVGVFQELLKETCLLAGVRQTMSEQYVIDNIEYVQKACEKKAEEYSARHQRALEALAAGNLSTSAKDGRQPLFLTYYLVRIILQNGYDGLATGMKRIQIQEKIQEIHHRASDVRGSDMSNLLHNLAKTQANKSISPPIIDYDRSKKMLQIVDSTFYFFLKHAELATIESELPNPMEQ